MDWKKTAEDLKELEPKIEAVCQRLWNEDRSAAVSVQAVTGEIKIVLGRAAQALEKLAAELAKKEELAVNAARQLKDASRKFEEELKTAGERIEKLTKEAGTGRETAGQAAAAIEVLKEKIKVEQERSASLQRELAAAGTRAEAAQREAASGLEAAGQAAAAIEILKEKIKVEQERSVSLQKELAAAGIRAEAAQREAASGLEAAGRTAIMILHLEEELKTEKARGAVFQDELKAARARTETALRAAAELEDQLASAKESHLKAEARKDTERSKEMADLMAGLAEKERELKASWAHRTGTLDAEQKELQNELKKKHETLLEDLRVSLAGMERTYAEKEARLIELNRSITSELQEREAKARAAEDDLRAQAAMLSASAAELEREYEVKLAEIEACKQKLLAEYPKKDPVI